MKLQDSVIAITGAARGLGQETARQLAEKGASLALIDLGKEDCNETRSQCEAFGVRVESYACNVADEQAVEATFTHIQSDFGQLNGLVNNAGILRDGLLVKHKTGEPLSKLSLSDWQAVIDVNLTGVFLCGREAARAMIETQSAGCIVNLSSVARAGNIGQSNYSAAKAGVVALTTTWAKELARYSIRSMAIAPGFIETDMTGNMPEQAKAHLARVIPLGKAGQPLHIAQSIVHVFENDYLSGRVIEVDGALRV